MKGTEDERIVEGSGRKQEGRFPGSGGIFFSTHSRDTLVG